MFGSRRVLGDVGNTQSRSRLSSVSDMEDRKPMVRKAKLKHVPLILQRSRKEAKLKEKVVPIKEIKVKPKKEPKPKVKIENVDDNPYPKPPYSYMAMIQVCADY